MLHKIPMKVDTTPERPLRMIRIDRINHVTLEMVAKGLSIVWHRSKPIFEVWYDGNDWSVSGTDLKLGRGKAGAVTQAFRWYVQHRSTFKATWSEKSLQAMADVGVTPT